MQKGILLSTRPKWVEKIAHKIGEINGKAIYEKPIEVRKSRPKLETPFKVYIYCTQGKDLLREVDNWHTGTKTHTTNYRIINLDYCTNKIANGKVIGEFVCDRIDEFHAYELEPSKSFYDIEKARLDLFLKESCLSYNEVCNYRKNLPYFKPLYGWHISDLKIYDKPKELSEFRTPEWFRDCEKSCDAMERMRCPTKDSHKVDKMCGWCRGGDKPITRPPQSWCYVEAQE